MKCKYCSEEIQNDAIVCKHCKKSLNGNDKNKMIIGFIVGFIVAAISIKSLYSSDRGWEPLIGIIVIIGSMLGGVFAVVAKKF